MSCLLQPDQIRSGFWCFSFQLTLWLSSSIENFPHFSSSLVLLPPLSSYYLCPFIKPPIHLSVYPSVCSSICLLIHLSVRPSACSSVCLSIYPSIRPSVHPSINPSTHLSAHLSIPPSFCLSVLSIRLLSVYPPSHGFSFCGISVT